ncbi:MAG: type IV toxin-antitoxin system AbiEi family antitoxin domain-containing protein [Polyangiales bacterium]
MDTAPWQPDDAPAALDLAVVLPEEFRAPPAPTRSTPTAKPATTKAAAKPATTKATAKPATTKATAKPATTKATAKPATTKAAAKPAAKPAKPANAADAAPGAKLPPPGKLFTLKDLAALGHGPADVKRLLKSGAIVRESFGWYRVATV